MNSSLEMQLNPLTPMAYLPPSLANQASLLGYVTVAAFSIQLWDMLNHLAFDYRMLTQSKITLPTIVYFVSRFSNLACLLAQTLFQVAPLSNCRLGARLNGITFSIAIPSTSLLFFLRLRAMYKGRIFIVIFFFVQWLLVIAASMIPIFGADGIHIGPSNHCIMVISNNHFLWASALVPLLNDSFIFIALSWRLMTMYSDKIANVKDGARTIVFGHNLPAFSRGLLHDGQIYYLTTVGLTLVTVIAFNVHSIPPLYRLIFSTPNIALINIMACRVYRKTKSGCYRLSVEGPSLPFIEFHDSQTAKDSVSNQNANEA